jgi:hypothetical protein
LSDPKAVITIPPLGIVAGAVYNPVVEIFPIVAFPPGISFTPQVTVGGVSPVTVAVYCSVAFTPILVYPGVSVIV